MSQIYLTNVHYCLSKRETPVLNYLTYMDIAFHIPNNTFRLPTVSARTERIAADPSFDRLPLPGHYNLKSY